MILYLELLCQQYLGEVCTLNVGHVICVLPREAGD